MSDYVYPNPLSANTGAKDSTHAFQGKAPKSLLDDRGRPADAPSVRMISRKPSRTIAAMRRGAWGLAFLAFLLLPGTVRSQSTAAGTQASTQAAAPAASSQVRVPAFVEFQGSINHLGAIMMVDGDVGLRVTKNITGDLGVPLLLSRSPFTPVATADWYYSGAISEPYVDVRYTKPFWKVNLTSILTGTIPIGNEEKTFTTGRFGADWFNHVDKKFGLFTPFVNVEASNGAVNRFVLPRPFEEARPYETLGMLTDFEGGTDVKVIKGVQLGASYYGYLPIGPQKVFSRLVLPYSVLGGSASHDRYFNKTFETVGNSSIDRDNGYSGWLDVTWLHPFDFQLGYTHSVRYKLDTYTLTLTFDAGHLVKAITGH